MLKSKCPWRAWNAILLQLAPRRPCSCWLLYPDGSWILLSIGKINWSFVMWGPTLSSNIQNSQIIWVKTMNHLVEEDEASGWQGCMIGRPSGGNTSSFRVFTRFIYLHVLNYCWVLFQSRNQWQTELGELGTEAKILRLSCDAYKLRKHEHRYS